MSLAYPAAKGVAWKPAAAAAGLVVAAMLLGQLATTPNLPWYYGLNKPWFNPPNWVFAPVWTTLYALMGYAYYRVARLPDYVQGRRAALTAFVVLIVLNTLWSYAFFAAHSPALGLVDIFSQIAALIVTTILFARLDRLAGATFLPLALWVLYATALNVEIWRMN